MSSFFYPRKDELKNYENLGLVKKPILVPKKWLKNSFISFFYKTPRDIVCPHFWNLKPFIGCPFECNYCFLQGTFFGNKRPRLKDFNKMTQTLEEFLSWTDSIGIRVLFNVGELCDSLAIPSWTEHFLEKMAPLLERHSGNKLLFLSKAGANKIDQLLDNPDLKRHIITSFSLNPPFVIATYEKKTAPLESRLQALKNLQKKGYEIRIRIDPIISVKNWEIYYSELVSAIFESRLKPKRITIGSLRGLQRTIFFAKDKKWTKYLDRKEKTGWGLKIRKELRLDLYTTILEQIREYRPNMQLALCKETPDLWKSLVNKNLLSHPGKSPSWENTKCNCKF